MEKECTFMPIYVQESWLVLDSWLFRAQGIIRRTICHFEVPEDPSIRAPKTVFAHMDRLMPPRI